MFQITPKCFPVPGEWVGASDHTLCDLVSGQLSWGRCESGTGIMGSLWKWEGNNPVLQVSSTGSGTAGRLLYTVKGETNIFF